MTGQELRKLLQERNMRTSELAERLGVSRRTIERYCSGRSEIKPVYEMVILAVFEK